MKKAACILLLTITLFSCSKEKDATIIGDWEMIAKYAPDASGQFSWQTSTATTYTPRLNLTPQGTFNVIGRDLAAAGKYVYDYTSKQLRFETLPSGNVTVSTVSYLDNDFLVIDHYINSDLQSKEKYTRK